MSNRIEVESILHKIPEFFKKDPPVASMDIESAWLYFDCVTRCETLIQNFVLNSQESEEEITAKLEEDFPKIGKLFFAHYLFQRQHDNINEYDLLRIAAFNNNIDPAVLEMLEKAMELKKMQEDFKKKEKEKKATEKSNV